MPSPQFFGAIAQLGVVVKDIEGAMEHWSKNLGVGPWFYISNMSPDNWRYKGQPSPPPKLSIAMAYSGDLQIELIQQLDDAPSMYKDFLDSGMEGLQHHGIWCKNYDEMFERAVKSGLKIGQQGTVGGPGKFAYFDTPTHAGSVMELVELNEEREALFKMMKEAAANWDGKNAINRL